MHDPQDKREFADIMEVVMLLYGKDATPALLRLYWNALIAHPIEQVRWACDHWVKDPKQGTFMPKPADIIRTIEEEKGTSGPQWLSANEAWAIALPATDEAATVVWTPEMAKALEVARPILEGGDKIGARMAFIPAYERLVDQAKRENREPVYEISAGWDPHLREVALKQAVTAGLLPPPKVDHAMLPPPNETPEQKAAREQEEQANRQRLSEQLADLSKKLKERDESVIRDRLEAQQQAQQAFEARKAEAIKQLQEHQNEQTYQTTTTTTAEYLEHGKE